MKLFYPLLRKNILSENGKSICNIYSAVRGETVTAACCKRSTGTIILPTLLFPRKMHRLFKDAPPRALNLVTETGCMNTD